MFFSEKSLQLQKSLQLFCSSSLNSTLPRIELSSGTTQEIENFLDQKYCAGAFVPQEPWRKPKLEEANLLFGSVQELDKTGGNIGTSIGIVQIDNHLISPLENLLEEMGIRSGKSIEAQQTLINSSAWKNAISHLMDNLSSYYLYNNYLEINRKLAIERKNLEIKIVSEQLINHGLRVALPGLMTITQDDPLDIDNNSYIGMHLDNWDNAPLRRRHKSRNRLCINLGREERFFLFINLSLIDMFFALGYTDEEYYKKYRGTTLGNEFMQCFPSYPIIRLRVLPGEAYIAPTDNIIHDGSSLGKEYPDITLTFIGRFGVTKTPQDVNINLTTLEVIC